MKKTTKQDGRPSIQFYPGDVLNEASLQLVSLEAVGAAYFLLMHMMRSPKRGALLKANGKQPLAKDIAKWIHSDQAKAEQLVAELIREEVYSIADDGMIYNRRLFRKWQLSQIRSKAGSKGGKSSKKKAKGAASSSSSSSTKEEEVKGKKKGEAKLPAVDGVTDDGRPYHLCLHDNEEELQNCKKCKGKGGYYTDEGPPLSDEENIPF